MDLSHHRRPWTWVGVDHHGLGNLHARGVARGDTGCYELQGCSLPSTDGDLPFLPRMTGTEAALVSGFVQDEVAEFDVPNAGRQGFLGKQTGGCHAGEGVGFEEIEVTIRALEEIGP